MSLDDDNHANNYQQKIKARQSMDREFHDQMQLDDSGESEADIGESSHSVIDDDEDSFCAASDDCAPDKEFLASVLEEYHPERLNLLDQSVPEPLTKAKQEAIVRERKPSIHIESTNKTVADPKEKEKEKEKETEKENTQSSDSDAPTTNGTSTDAESHGKKEILQNTTEHSEVDEAEEAEDKFPTSPVATKAKARPSMQRPGLQRPGLDASGETAKKSFRSINGKNFWSKPFRVAKKAFKRGGSDS